MAKKKIAKYVFEPGVSKDSNLYPNAVALLTANKAFLQAQVVAFINDQISSNTAPYAGYTYASQKCTRDVGFFIDAVIHDIRYGGNVKSRQVADYFWINGEPMIRGDVSPEIAGQTYLRDIINNFIFTNTAVTPSYGQTAVAQTFFLTNDGESGSSARNTSLWSVFSTVIENGLSAMPAKIPGVSSIRMIGNYDISDILLITDVTSGEILYNFADPANSISLELKQGRSSGDGNLLSDLDFPKWYQIDDAITSLNLSKDTSSLSQLTDLQIFVEEPYITTRPWDFGTDAIERIRVSNPQAMLDADFEYGLQPTKWQALGLIRSYPGLYEIPGSDLEIINVVTDASEDTGGFGASLITVTTSSAHGFSIGQPITVKGLLNSVQGFGRAEGSFLIYSVPAANRFTYYSSAKVGTISGTSIYTSAAQIREAKYYTGAAIGQPTFSVFSNGSNTTVASKFDTEAGEISIAFVGTAPAPGSPISGSASIPLGTSISGTVGSEVVLAVILDEIVTTSQTFITVGDTTGIQQGMAIEGGSNNALFINTIVGNTLNLSGAIGNSYAGSIATYTDVSGTNVESVGSGATFNVSYDGVYSVVDAEDSTSNGIDYQTGDVIRILGTSVGGTSPDNDVLVTVVSVDSVGSILSQSSAGTPPAGTANFVGVSGINDPIPGNGASFTVNKAGSVYTVTVSNGGSNYAVGNRIIVSGTALAGDSPQNDLIILVDSISSGSIVNVTEIGTASVGDIIQVFPILNISEALTEVLPDSATLNVGAIATVQVDFTSDHGIVPGTTMFNYITSTPAPEFTSTDVTLVNSGTHTGVAFINGVFIAIRSGQTGVDKSLDGETWISGGNLPTTAPWSSIAAGEVNGEYYFVAVATGGTAAAWSNDSGDTWTAATMPSSGTWSSVTYFDGRFVAVRSASNAAAYSLDGGQSWTSSTLHTSSAWTDVAGGLIGTSTYFIAVSSGAPGTVASFSADGGLTWSATGALPSAGSWSSITYGNNRFFTVMRTSNIGAYTTNGTTWTQSLLPLIRNWNSVTFGDENFVVVADASASALTSFNATTGSWEERTLSSTATWEEIAFGDYPGTNVFAVVGNLTNASKIVLTSANHQLAAGPFVISQVPSSTSLRYPARSTGFIDTESPMAGTIYVRPDAFFVHRPFDGGVQLGTGGPAHGSQAIRQSKKYVRYQSGKGIMYTTGALFAPSYNLSSAVAADTVLNSFITFTCDDTDHGLQPGAEIEIIGMISFEYNGTYIVEDIVDTRSFRVRSTAVLSTLNAELGSEAKVIMKRWRGATVRVGAFDEQNGIFYQYDGETMAVVIRKSTNQLIGTVSLEPESNLVVGAGTRFQEQLKAGDKIVIRGMTHTVARVIDQTSMTVAPDWRGANSITGAKICITEDMVIPQSDWNIDALDGTGPSGYNFLPWRMQMIGIQYTWYAAGFVEFMLRGADGRFIFLHRIRNSNVNTEAYMRTANLPVRYEVENASAKGRLKETITDVSTSMTLSDASRFPNQGIVYIDNEMISFTGKTGNTLTGLSRSASMTNFAAGQNRTYTAGLAAEHTAGTGLVLLDVTCTPTISHWGSALLTDGRFDEDRGYLFNYAATGIQANLTKQTAFMIRLAPSVSNALTGDLGERDLLNRAQLLLNEIAITANAQATADQGAIVVEGVLNPKNYPDNPANITWSGLSSTAAGGQPSFAQIALGGSINWGGIAGSTSTAAVQGSLTTTTSARAFNTVSQTITARRVTGLGFNNALDNNFTDFLIRTSDYDNITSTPLRIGDRLSASQSGNTFLNGQTIASITRNYRTSGGTSYTRIVMSSPAFLDRQNDISVTVTSVIATTYSNAFSTSRTDFLVTDADAASAGFLVGDTLTSSNVTSARTIQSIASTYARVSNVNYTRVVMNGTANSTSSAATSVTTTITAAGTASSYTGNFLFFTNSTFNSSGAGVGTRLATSVSQFPAGTAITGVEARILGSTTVQRVTFTQSSNTSIAAAANMTFQFGDPQNALPGEQVFSFVTNPGNTVSINLSELKELTTTAIGGRGTFPNGPDVLAINVLKIAGTACPVSVVLRWGEAQA